MGIFLLLLWVPFFLVRFGPHIAGTVRGIFMGPSWSGYMLLLGSVAACVLVVGPSQAGKTNAPPSVETQRMIRMYYQDQQKRYVPVDAIIRRGWRTEP